MTTRTRLKDEEEWREFWADFFGEDIIDECDWKNDEKIKHRKSRRANRKYKMILVKKNEPRQKHEDERAKRKSQVSGKDIKSKRISLYRLVNNGKNRSPSKPIPRREKNFFLKEISENVNYEI